MIERNAQVEYLKSELTDLLRRSEMFTDAKPLDDYGRGLCAGEVFAYLSVGSNFGLLTREEVKTWSAAFNPSLIDETRWQEWLDGLL